MRLLLLLIAMFALLVTLPGGGRNGDLAAAPTAPPPGKRIALSFDDAPRGAGAFLSQDARTDRLIAALAAAKVGQVAFFVNPGRIAAGDGDKQRLARYVAAGHVIANHSFSHPKLSRTDAAAYLADIDKATAWLAGRRGYRPWYRFPTLDEGGTDRIKRDAVRAGLAARGLRNAYVTVDGLDWAMEADTIAAARAGRTLDMDALRALYVETMVQSADFGDALAIRATGRSPAHMLLLHETDLAALFIGDLIDALRRDGWEVVDADTAYADPIYAHAPETPFANGTLVEQLAWEKKLTGPRWYERNDIGVAHLLFDARVLHGAARGALKSAR